MRVCIDCKYGELKTTETPCCVCFNNREKPQWELKMKENDYSFNQDIIDALRERKAIWYRIKGEIKWTFYTYIEDFYLGEVFRYNWSISKPKTKVKKKIERFANIYGDDNFTYYPDKESAIRSAKHHDNVVAIAVPFVIEYEVEV